jgi:glycolate oxidase iron-sulfur subunit
VTEDAAPTTLRILDGLGPQLNDERKTGPALHLDGPTYERALDCVHCGLCLPACPTYTQNGLEADSPRGRIYLIKGLADGRIEANDSVMNHLDLCLDCRACETACPSGVVYHELIEAARSELAPKRKRGVVDKLIDFIFYRIFPHPGRLRLAVLPARVLQKLRLWTPLVRSPLVRLLPASLAKMQQMLPSRGPLWEKPLAARYPADAADGRRRATVAVMGGCVGSVMFQHVNRQMIRLLQHAGCEVIVPPEQVCCGAILHHGGRVQEAEDLARKNIEAFAVGEDVDFIVTNIAGCGAMLRDYDHLLRADPQFGPRAANFTGKVRDISEVLDELLPESAPRTIERTVTYHDACHLAHAQKVTEAPRRLLRSIKGLKLVELTDSQMCCGAAGTYNLAHPQMAMQLAERKIGHIRDTGAPVCVTGNVGCAMQIQSEADRLGTRIEVIHPVTLLYEAYFGPAEE